MAYLMKKRLGQQNQKKKNNNKLVVKQSQSNMIKQKIFKSENVQHLKDMVYKAQMPKIEEKEENENLSEDDIEKQNVVPNYKKEL